MLHPLYYSQILKVNSFKKFSRINEMEDDQLLLSLMQVFIAQMDSALKISNIISEHSNEEEMSPDSLVTGLVYRLMISMDDKEMKESMEKADQILHEEDSGNSGSDEEQEEVKNEEEENRISRNIKKNTCNCNICAKARACLLNYPSYEVSDQLAQKFKDAIDNTCTIHKLNIV
tara:strand:- start:118 stop:639 length:522 start_codon:yes stop_codon:yes gene_type:complete